jgi:hypothetical protein
MCTDHIQDGVRLPENDGVWKTQDGKTVASKPVVSELVFRFT